MEKETMIRLVQKAQAGDHKALEKLFDGFYNDVYYFALKTLQDQELACDITQETFLQVIQSIGQLQEPAAFAGWLKQIAYHQCTGYFKKKKEVLVEEDEDGNTVFDRLEDEGELPQEILEQEEFRQTILSMVEQLTEEQRTAVMLYYYDEMSVTEIAEIQGVSTGTVKSRMNYARKSLKNSVESYEKKHGIKLRCVGFLPLFMLLFGKEVMPAKAVKTVRSTVSGAAKAAMGGAGIISGGVVAAAAAVVAAAVAVGGGFMAARNWDPPKQEETPVVIEQSQDDPLVLCHMLLPEDFSAFAPNTPAIFYTKDGRVRRTAAPEVDLPFKREDVRYCYSDHLVYADSQGVLHAWDEQGSAPLTGASGEPFLMLGSYPRQDVCLLMDDGSMQMAEVFDGEVYIASLQFQDLSTGTVYDRADHVAIMLLPEGNVTICIHKDDMVYCGKPEGDRLEDGLRTVLLTSVNAVPSANVLTGIDNGFVYFTWDDLTTIYLLDGPVKLPEGKTVEDITWLYSANVTMVRFETEQVYVYGAGMDGFEVSQLMTDLLVSDQLRGINNVGNGNHLILELSDGQVYVPKIRERQ